jgi:hypothetical protein
MRRLLRNRHPWIWAALFAAFWILAKLIPFDPFLLFTNSFTTVVMAVVAYRYFPDFVKAIRRQAPSIDETAVFYIKTGILFSYGASFIGRVYNMIWFQSARNSVDASNDVTAFIQMCVGFGGLYLLMTPSLSRSVQARRRTVVMILGVSLALALCLWIVNPDTTRLMDALRPWTPR